MIFSMQINGSKWKVAHGRYKYKSLTSKLAVDENQHSKIHKHLWSPNEALVKNNLTASTFFCL